MSWSERYRYLRSRGSDLGGREHFSMILEKLTMMATGDWVKRPKVLPVMIQKKSMARTRSPDIISSPNMHAIKSCPRKSKLATFIFYI